MTVRPFILLTLLLAVPGRAADPRPADLPRPNGAAPALRKVESKYYWVHTDLSDADTREAALRLTRMGEEYAARTAGFSGAIRTKFPVYLFRHATDYYTAGGVPGSAGMFDGSRLLVVAGLEVGPQTWHTMQHEGFHQFAHAVIGGDLPTWADEGLAEYFGEGVWTGDGFVTGVVPHWRLRRVRDTIARERFKPVADILAITLGEWNTELAIEHYDQAWSMVHFLVHADDGRYRKPFALFMSEVGRGRGAARSWEKAFGDAQGFERKWLDWWKSLPDDPTADAFDRATVSTIASFLGRAAARKQSFASYDAFVSAVGTRQFALPPTADDWLPPSLFEDAVERARESGKVTIEGSLPAPPGQKPPAGAGAAAKQSAPADPKPAAAKGPLRVVLTRPDGRRAVATIELQGAKVKAVTATFDDTAGALAEFRRLTLVGEKDKAKSVLQDALKRNPDSPLAPEAREALSTPKPTAK